MLPGKQEKEVRVKIRKRCLPIGNSTLRKREDHLGRRDLRCQLIYCYHWKKKCRTNFKIQHVLWENCNHRRNQKQKAFPTNEFLFLGNFFFKLQLHAVYLYHFSFNSSIQSQHKGKMAIKVYVTVRIFAVWAISCAMAYGFYGITCCIISFPFWNWIFTFAAYHKISLLSSMLHDGVGGLPRVKFFSRFGWQPSLLISMKLQWFMVMHYLPLP